MPGAGDPGRALELASEARARLDVDAVVAHLSTAIRGFTASGEPCRAAMACVALGDTLANAMGNLTAARAWFARARRLVADEPPCVEQGWVAVAAMGCDVDDPAELLAAAELALGLARRFGDVDLETKALADAGLAHVQAGRIATGMAMLEEAMALACGLAGDTETAAKSVCSFFTACYFTADFARAGSWAELLRHRGLIGVAPGPPVFLASHCDSVQATLLVELGRWADAEALLQRARGDFMAVMGAPSWHPDIALADLRIRQGRLTDAEALLLGKDQALQALLPAARLHLARGDHDLARATARRGLRVLGADRLRAVELLTVVVDAELGDGDVDAALEACTELAARSGELDLPALQARGAAARARAAAAGGDLGGAIATVEAAVDRIDPRTLPWLHATLLVDLARLRDRAGDRAGAAIEATAAAATLAALDVVVPAGDVEVLERLARRGRDADTAGRTASLVRDGRWWVASCAGTTVRLPETKGLRYLAELVAHPHVERHVLDLVDQVEGVPGAGGPDRRTLGDAGEVLDHQARSAYRRQVERLRVEIDDALAADRLEHAEALQGELDLIVAQLAQAFGLGGRSRRASSAAERARLNVTRALRSAVTRLAEALPDTGAGLHERLRTGTYCAYEPGPDDEVRWVVQRALNDHAPG